MISMLDYFYYLCKYFFFSKNIIFNIISLNKNILDLVLVKSLTIFLLSFMIVLINQLLIYNLFFCLIKFIR